MNSGCQTFNLSDLPIELLFKICSFLKTDDLMSMIHVCRKLRCLTLEDRRLWRFIRINPKRNSLFCAEFLSRYHGAIQKLTFQHEEYYQHSDDKVQEMLEHFSRGCENLQSLDLGFSTNRQIIECLVTSFPNLKELKMAVTSYNFEVENINRLTALTALHKLDLSNSWGLNDAAVLDVIAQNFPNLEELNIEGVGAECDEGVINVILLHHDTLKNLYLGGFGLTDSSYEKLEMCQALQELSISDGKNMTDRALASIQKLPNLRKLVLGKIYDLTSDGLLDFFQTLILSNLNYLDITDSKLCDRGALAIANNNCRNLRYLILGKCRKLTDRGIRAILESNRYLVSLKLDINAIPEELLLAIPRKLPALSHLTLWYTKVIDVDYSQPIARLRLSAPNLEVVEDYENVAYGLWL